MTKQEESNFIKEGPISKCCICTIGTHTDFDAMVFFKGRFFCKNCTASIINQCVRLVQGVNIGVNIE